MTKAADIMAAATPGRMKVEDAIGPHTRFDHDGMHRHHHHYETGDAVWWENADQFGGDFREHRHVPTTPREDAPDYLDGARAEYRECLEVRRLLGYLWTATGKSPQDPVSSLFDEDDPIVADIERLAIFSGEGR